MSHEMLQIYWIIIGSWLTIKKIFTSYSGLYRSYIVLYFVQLLGKLKITCKYFANMEH